MNAWRVDATCGMDALACAEAQAPVPRSGEVLIEVHACGLNFSDLLMIAGRYQVRPPVPFIPGQEIAGRVVGVAPGSARRVGERVASKVLWGGFAELAIAKENMLVRLPDRMAYAAGATLPVVWPTAWIALFDRARLEAGETILVHAAAGGVGLAAVQLARNAGATVIAGVGDEAKTKTAREAGAAHAVVTSIADWPARVSELTGGRGPAIVFDPVGGDLADASLKIIARNGRYLIVGFAGGEIPRLAASRLLLKNASALGVYWSHEEDGPLVSRSLAEIFALWDAGKVRIAAGRSYPFDMLRAALADLAARRTTGKCVLAVKEEKP
jgi:NADPH2:quinone reductase